MAIPARPASGDVFSNSAMYSYHGGLSAYAYYLNLPVVKSMTAFHTSTKHRFATNRREVAIMITQY